MSKLRHKALTQKAPTGQCHPRLAKLKGFNGKTRALFELQFEQALDRITALEAQVKYLHALFSARLSDDIDFRSEFERMRLDMKK
jgi:hypothetical protein